MSKRRWLHARRAVAGTFLASCAVVHAPGAAALERPNGSATTAAPAAAALAGTWRLVYYMEQRPNGEWVAPPLGTNLTGWIMYDGRGHVCVEIARSDRPRFGRDEMYAYNQYAGTVEEKAKAYDGYGAYCATYTVDEAAAFVVHHVELSMFPNVEGTTQKRFYRFESDRLILDFPPFERDGETRSARLIWERLQ